jgi:hypothetical protein
MLKQDPGFQKKSAERRFNQHQPACLGTAPSAYNYCLSNILRVPPGGIHAGASSRHPVTTARVLCANLLNSIIALFGHAICQTRLFRRVTGAGSRVRAQLGLLTGRRRGGVRRGWRRYHIPTPIRGSRQTGK